MGRLQAEAASQCSAQNGTRFPFGVPSGNGIPVWSLRTGRAFRMDIQTETVSQNPASEWDTVSGWHHLRKLRPRISLTATLKHERQLRALFNGLLPVLTQKHHSVFVLLFGHFDNSDLSRAWKI